MFSEKWYRWFCFIAASIFFWSIGAEDLSWCKFLLFTGSWKPSHMPSLFLFDRSVSNELHVGGSPPQIHVAPWLCCWLLFCVCNQTSDAQPQISVGPFWHVLGLRQLSEAFSYVHESKIKLVNRWARSLENFLAKYPGLHLTYKKLKEEIRFP